MPGIYPTATRQRVKIRGSGNIVVQLHGDHSRVNLEGAPYLVLTPWQRRAENAPVQSEIDLLLPYHRAIPLVGRDADMQKLWQWLHSDLPISVRTVTGRAGAGKTRIAVDLMNRLGEERGNSWHAGFVTEEEMTRFSGQQNLSAWGWRRPTLIVLDYAGAHLRALWRWLHELALTPRGDGRPALRLLLLERQASLDEGWYRGLQDASHSGAGVARLFDPVEPVPLQPLEAAADRRQVLRAMLGEGASFLKTAAPPVPAPDQDPYFDKLLAGEQWADPLYLMMAALVSLQHGLVVALALSRKDLAMRLAGREEQRIRRYAGDPLCAEAGLLAHLAAYVTLCGGLTGQDALAAAREECEVLQRHHPNGPGALVDLLRAAMPGAPHLAALKPDIIGEAFFLQVFGGSKIDAGTRAVLRAARRAGDTVAASVLRTAQDFSYGDPRHSDSEVHLEPLTWLEALIQAGQADNPGLLLAIDAEMPEHTLVLREHAARVCQLLIDRLTLAALDLPAELRAAEEARLRNNLGNRLSDLGRREEALASAEEAVSIRRQLAAQRPEAFLPDLAGSLNNLGNRLSDLGRPEEALASAEEAVSIRRQLAAQRPEAFLPGLARSLNNLGNRLSALGRPEEALASAEEAVGIYRRLAGERPEAFLPDLARSLNNLGNRLSELGRPEEALASAEEAVSIRRQLAAQRPEAFLPDLAASLNSLGNRLSALGRPEEALASAEEALGIYRQLAGERPEAFLPDLAASLNNLGTLLSELGRPEEALGSAEEAVSIRRQLAAQRPEAFLPDLAAPLNNLGAMQSALGRPEEALASAEEALGIYRQLAVRRPEAFLPYLAASLNNLGNLLSDLGRREEALASAEEAVGIYRRLAGERPEAFLPDLAASLNNLGNRLSELGRREEALASAEEAVSIRRRLAGERPEAFLPDLARSLGALGACLAGMERHTRAAAAFGEGLTLLGPLFQKIPAAFGPLILALLGGYMREVEALGQEPDLQLLTPILEGLQRLDKDREEES